MTDGFFLKFEDAVVSGARKDGKIRFKDFTDIWLEHHARPNLKIKTVVEYEKRLVLINKHLGHYKLEEIKRSHLNEFYKTLAKTAVREDNRYTLQVDLLSKLEELKL